MCHILDKALPRFFVIADFDAMQWYVCLSVLHTVSDMQDVTAFLSWAAEPEHDDRKLMGVKWIFVLSLVLLTAAYYKRWKWAPIKSRRVVVDALN